jgi:pullulanase
MGGEEFLRSKPKDESGTVFDDNSYRSPDFVNSLKWSRKSEYIEVFNYYKGLIAFRNAHRALRMTRAEEIRNELRFLEGLEPNVVAFILDRPEIEIEGTDNTASNETETASSGKEALELICAIYNANRRPISLSIPEGEWKVFAKGTKAGNEIMETVMGDEVMIEPVSAMILGR